MIMTHMYRLVRSPQQKSVMSIEMRIMIPPMVGVPDFVRCVWGPSSRICWVMLILLSHRIMHGPMISETIIAVRTATAVLNVMYRNTFIVEKNGCSARRSL